MKEGRTTVRPFFVGDLRRKIRYNKLHKLKKEDSAALLILRSEGEISIQQTLAEGKAIQRAFAV